MQARASLPSMRASFTTQRTPIPRARTLLRPVQAAASAVGTDLIAECGAASQQGTVRKQNEDRFSVDVGAESTPVPYAAVFDGHGGYACADWLATNFPAYLTKFWADGAAPVAGVTEAFLAADRRVLQPKQGLFGAMGERGVGGSKCGATAAVALLYRDSAGKPTLLAANAGDARVVIGKRGGATTQLTVDHVPDAEEERLRIERQNPNPRQPLVRYVGGTWRVGGLLALSRAFGDAYLKGTGQFEGVQAGSDGYSSGFGVVAEPDIAVVELTPGEDTWVVVSSDGLFANEERGGGGGLTNERVVALCEAAGAGGLPCSQIAQLLIDAAVEAGTTDDVTVVVMKLAA